MDKRVRERFPGADPEASQDGLMICSQAFARVHQPQQTYLFRNSRITGSNPLP